MTAARRGRPPVSIGDWTLYADQAALRRGDEERRLPAKALHVLLVLVDAGDAAVSREELLDAVWGSGYPTDAVVSRAIADLRSAFGEAAGDEAYIRTLPKFGYQLVATSARPETASGERPTFYVPLTGAALVVLILVIATWLWPLGRPPDATVPTDNRRLPPARPLTAEPGLEHQPRIVPGGDWVVYAALRPGRSDWDLFRASLEDGMSQAVAVVTGVTEHGPAVSPTGEEVAYVRMGRTGCDVVVQPLRFGVPEPLTACTGKFPTLVDWSPDGRRIAFTGSETDDPEGLRRIWTIDREAAELSVVSRAVPVDGSDFYPRFSPNGESIAFLRGEPQPDHRTTIWRADLESGREQRITPQPAQYGGMSWINDRTLLYSVNRAGRFETFVHDLATGSSSLVGSEDLIHPDYSPAEKLLVAAVRRSERELAILDASHSVGALASSTSDDHDASYSPDAKFVAFISRRSGFDELWVADTRGQATRRLTRFDGATLRYPSWHPDGQRILFTVQTGAGERIHEIDVVSGSLRMLDSSNVEATTPVWMPDGRRVVYGCRAESGWGLCVDAPGGVRRLADDYYRPQPLDADTIAAVDSRGVLSRVRVADGSSTPIWAGLPANGRLGWTLRGQTLLYLVPAAPANSGRIIRRDLRSGEERTVYEGMMPLADTRIEFAPGSETILFTRYEAASDDLVSYAEPLKLP